MKRLLLYAVLITALVVPCFARATITREFSGPSEKQTASAFDTNNTGNYSDTFWMRDYETISFQLVFASITGTQPAVKLQVTNDGTNWDDVTGVTHTTTAAAESTTKIVVGIVGSGYRWKVSTASTTGTCTVTAVGNGRAQ